jgi:hypothetical protein
MTFGRLFGRRRRRYGAGRITGGLAGLAAGAGLMYLVDPRGGAWRRSHLAQRAGRAVREVEHGVEAGVRDLEHRARGLAHEAKARIEREHVGDEVIVERVRAKLGRLAAHASAIEVISREGKVELAGPVFRAEHGQVLRGVRLVRGVRGVEDRLEPHETSEGVPALQGAGPRRGPRPDPLQERWAPGTRLLAGAAASVFVARALFGRSLLRIPAGVAAAALFGNLLGESAPAQREGRRLARAASAAASRERDSRRDREQHQGAWHPEPEVREVKSPAELEKGIASASPEPTFANRADRGGERSSGAGPGWSATGEARAVRAAGTEDVAPRAGYVAPEPGAAVRDAELGSTSPPASEGDDDDREGEASARRPPGDPER